MNGVNSNTVRLTHSIPQGSNLGPLLFLIYINDFPCCSNYFKFIMFADDCTVTSRVARNELPVAHTAINDNLCRISEWLVSNKIQINVSKTKYLIYSLRGDMEFMFPVKMGRSVIARENSVKFLGVILDNRLSFSMHIDSISSKISRTLGVLSKISSFVPRRVLVSLYYSLVQPYISYALEARYGAPAYLTNKIVVLQKRAIRCICSLGYNEHTQPHFENMRVLTLSLIHI